MKKGKVGWLVKSRREESCKKTFSVDNKSIIFLGMSSDLYTSSLPPIIRLHWEMGPKPTPRLFFFARGHLHPALNHEYN